MGAPQASAQPKKEGAHTDDDRCSAEAQFTTCRGNNRDEFFFDAEADKCRSKVLERPPACLVGQNRFKSVHDCKLACLDREVSEGRCRSLPRFQRCTAQDIVRQWWYLKNGTCHEWKLPNSNCVSPRLALFESREHCHSTCVAGSPVARHLACSETPVEHPCTAVHMVYPVLAVPRLRSSPRSSPWLTTWTSRPCEVASPCGMWYATCRRPVARGKRWNRKASGHSTPE
ncbi:uncharacterized protein LOC144167686 isoform X1 [Haemaphysalis longicornis]